MNVQGSLVLVQNHSLSCRSQLIQHRNIVWAVSRRNTTPRRDPSCRGANASPPSGALARFIESLQRGDGAHRQLAIQSRGVGAQAPRLELARGALPTCRPMLMLETAPPAIQPPEVIYGSRDAGALWRGSSESLPLDHALIEKRPASASAHLKVHHLWHNP